MKKAEIALAAGILLISGALTVVGCDSKPTAAGLIKKAKSMESDNMAMDMESEMNLSLVDDSIEFNYNSKINQSTSIKIEGNKIWAKTNTSNTEVLDSDTQENSQLSEMYIIPDGEKERVYVTIDNSDWMYYDQPYEETSYYSLPEIYDEGVEWTLSEEKVEVDGVEAYLLTGNLPVTESLLEDSLGDLSDTMAEAFKKLDLSQMKVSAKVWIGADKKVGLVRAEYDWGDSFAEEKFADTDLSGFSATLVEKYYHISFNDTKVEVPADVLSKAVEADLDSEYDAAETEAEIVEETAAVTTAETAAETQ